MLISLKVKVHLDYYTCDIQGLSLKTVHFTQLSIWALIFYHLHWLVYHLETSKALNSKLIIIYSAPCGRAVILDPTYISYIWHTCTCTCRLCRVRTLCVNALLKCPRLSWKETFILFSLLSSTGNLLPWKQFHQIIPCHHGNSLITVATGRISVAWMRMMMPIIVRSNYFCVIYVGYFNGTHLFGQMW